MTAKERWKKFYRLLRIARRESKKATEDMILYGSGFVRMKENGESERVEPWKVILEK